MSEGNVRPAGEGLSDQEMVEEVAGQTDSAMDAQDMDEDVRGGGGDDAGDEDDYDPASSTTDTEAAIADDDQAIAQETVTDEYH